MSNRSTYPFTYSRQIDKLRKKIYELRQQLKALGCPACSPLRGVIQGDKQAQCPACGGPVGMFQAEPPPSGMGDEG